MALSVRLPKPHCKASPPNYTFVLQTRCCFQDKDLPLIQKPLALLQTVSIPSTIVKSHHTAFQHPVDWTAKPPHCFPPTNGQSNQRDPTHYKATGLLTILDPKGTGQTLLLLQPTKDTMPQPNDQSKGYEPCWESFSLQVSRVEEERYYSSSELGSTQFWQNVIPIWLPYMEGHQSH